MNRARNSGRTYRIIEKGTHRLVGVCAGADPEGRCPAAGTDGAIPCSGRQVIPDERGPAAGLPFSVPASAEDGLCPLAWVDDVDDEEAWGDASAG